MPGPGVTSDLTAPNPARIYDYLTGGRDNFAADRDFGDALAAEVPGLRGLARDGRGFMIRSVTWSASRGIGQFLDLGCGLPSSPNVHETARATLRGRAGGVRGQRPDRAPPRPAAARRGRRGGR